MMTVHEVSDLTGVSVRTLQHYDNIGLLHPAQRTEAGYRLYDDASLEKLQQILLFRELEFSLKEIKLIVDAPDFDRERALDQQIELLTLRRQRLGNLISLARKLKGKGANAMSFEAFDTTKIDDYTAQAKASWGNTKEYKEFEMKDRGRTAADHQQLSARMMELFARMGELKEGSPKAPEAQALVQELQAFISEHYYQCSDEVLAGLGQMNGCGGEFTRNINAAAGDGAAEFAATAIEAYCASRA